MFKPLYLLLLILFGTIWGATIPLTKTAVSTGHQPLGLIFWQLVIAIILLTAAALFRRSTIRFDWAHCRFFFFVTLFGTLIPNTFSYWSNVHLPGGVMALVIATVPVFALLIGLVVGTEKLNWKNSLGVACGIIAVALLVLPDSSLPDAAKSVFIFVALIAPFAYGTEVNYLAVAQPPKTGPIATLLGASIIGCIIALPAALISDQFFIVSVSEFGKPEIALLASSCMHVIAYVGYIWLVSKTGVVFTSQIAYIVTPAGVILSAVFLGENHSSWLWTSLALMLVTLALIQPRIENDDAA